LTVPSAHASVSRSAILADKHVYSEKPMAIDFTEASALSALAKEHHVILACAPDTILGSAHKTARDLLDAGTLGMPFAAVAFLAKRGPERWHPNPDFFYQEGAGPLLDMGPYYMASLISLLGPVATVMGCTLSPQPYRVAGEDLESGRRFLSQVPTTSIGCLRFESGVATTLMFSFDVWGAGLPRIEIYCTKGTIRLPDPNDFEGEVIYRKAPEDGWKTADPSSTARQESRGAGLQEMARALSRGRKPAMDSEFALHAIDVLDLLRQCTPEGTIARTRSTCHRPAQGDAG
jgi:predicted dehydrogenase